MHLIESGVMRNCLCEHFVAKQLESLEVFEPWTRFLPDNRFIDNRYS
jgi:hypothetical protein